MPLQAHSFYVYLAPSIVVGLLLTCQSLDPEYKMTVFFQIFRCSFKKKIINLIFGSIRYYNIIYVHMHVCICVPVAQW